eukprot:2577724-Pyramimonas_sp.AAC.1
MLTWAWRQCAHCSWARAVEIARVKCSRARPRARGTVQLRRHFAGETIGDVGEQGWKGEWVAQCDAVREKEAAGLTRRGSSVRTAKVGGRKMTNRKNGRVGGGEPL